MQFGVQFKVSECWMITRYQTRKNAPSRHDFGACRSSATGVA